MLNDKRKEELEILLRWASCADEKYYFNMAQDVFDEVLARDKNVFKPYVYQREIGFEEFRAEMAEKLSAIHLADEIHYMLADYNFDDNPWVIEQLIMNPACVSKGS